MYIVDQTRSEITNTENVTHINYDAGIVYAYIISGTKRVLGNYSESRASEIFRKLLADCFPPMAYVANCNPEEVKMCFDNPPVIFSEDKVRITAFDCGVYYMPEE